MYFYLVYGFRFGSFKFFQNKSRLVAESPVFADMFGRERMGRIKVGTRGRLLTLRGILSSLNSFTVTYMNDLFTISFTLSTNYQWIGDENELIA